MIFPVLSDRGRIDGFIGRDTTGDPRAPKYRNPTRTTTFTKSTALYRPTRHRPDRDANVVIVEGVIDALAIAATAARGSELPMFAAVTANGVTVSAAQARAVLALHPKPPVIAMDGDRAGREGTDRWLEALCIERRRPAMVTRLPDGVDPAEWLQHQGIAGLAVFDRRRWIGANTDVRADGPRPQLPGRDLVRICLNQPSGPDRRVVDVLTHLALQLQGNAVRELLDQAGREMTVRGWNPRGDFSHALHYAIDHARRQAAVERRPHPMTAAGARLELSTESLRVDAHQIT